MLCVINWIFFEFFFFFCWCCSQLWMKNGSWKGFEVNETKQFLKYITSDEFIAVNRLIGFQLNELQRSVILNTCTKRLQVGVMKSENIIFNLIYFFFQIQFVLTWFTALDKNRNRRFTFFFFISCCCCFRTKCEF